MKPGIGRHGQACGFARGTPLRNVKMQRIPSIILDVPRIAAGTHRAVLPYEIAARYVIEKQPRLSHTPEGHKQMTLYPLLVLAQPTEALIQVVFTIFQKDVGKESSDF